MVSRFDRFLASRNGVLREYDRAPALASVARELGRDLPALSKRSLPAYVVPASWYELLDEDEKITVDLLAERANDALRRGKSGDASKLVKQLEAHLPIQYHLRTLAKWSLYDDPTYARLLHDRLAAERQGRFTEARAIRLQLADIEARWD